jgi:hypothetical protein
MTVVFYLGTIAMGSGTFYCSRHRRIPTKKEEIRRGSQTHQELSRKKGKRNKKCSKKKPKNLLLIAAVTNSNHTIYQEALCPLKKTTKKTTTSTKNMIMSSKKCSSKQNEVDEIDLTDMDNMVNSFCLTSVNQPSSTQKKKSVLHHGYLPSLGSPFLIYEWKDSTKSKNMLNIKVLLFQEPRTLNDFAVDIEEKGDDDQKIVISQSLPSSWLSMTHCMYAFKNTEGEDRIAQNVRESTM